MRRRATDSASTSRRFRGRSAKNLAGPMAANQSFRTDEGRAPKTINGELSVLRQVLRHARLWYRFEDDYRALRNTKPPVGQALTDAEQKRLFKAAQSPPEWRFSYTASALAFFCG